MIMREDPFYYVDKRTLQEKMLDLVPGGGLIKLVKHLWDDDNDDDGETVINTYKLPPYVN